jgi:hypothetical protein
VRGESEREREKGKKKRKDPSRCFFARTWQISLNQREPLKRSPEMGMHHAWKRNFLPKKQSVVPQHNFGSFEQQSEDEWVGMASDHLTTAAELGLACYANNGGCLLYVSKTCNCGERQLKRVNDDEEESNERIWPREQYVSESLFSRSSDRH